MKSKGLILTLALGLVLVIGVTATLIAAWLTDTDTTDDTVFTVGDIQYTWAGAVITDTYVVPGQNLIGTTYTLTNGSNVGSELRVKVTAVSSHTGYTTDALSLLTITLAEDWSELTSGYYYYQGVEATEGKYIIVAGTQELDVLTSIIIDGAQVGNSFSGETFTITFTFEAKQADYVTWAELATVDFETGLAA